MRTRSPTPSGGWSKASHESRYSGGADPTDAVVEGLVANFAGNTLRDGSIIVNDSQAGGQTAHTITNIVLGAPAVHGLALDTELRNRNLGDITAPDFAMTKYGQRMATVDGRGELTALPSAGVFFALTDQQQIFAKNDEPTFLTWMNCNQRRYDPFPTSLFLPSPSPDRIGKGYVWHDGYVQCFRWMPPSRAYTKYLAIERDGYVEYGFYPRSLLLLNPAPAFARSTDGLYYAMIVAGFVAFLHFLKDLSKQFGLDSRRFSVGLGLRGVEGKLLLCITERVMPHFQSITPAPQDGFLFLSRAPHDLDWAPDDVAHAAAENILELWSYSAPAEFGTPEFRSSQYDGAFFRQRFNSSW
jgi:hypothetical protein